MSQQHEAISVVLVDDQQLLREGFKRLLDMYPQVSIVGTASDGIEAVALIRRLATQGILPSVVLMDIRMPRMNGVEATRAIHQEWPQVRIMFLTTFDDEEYVVEGLQAGATGYLLKDASVEQLLDAIQAVHRGESPLQPSVAAKLVERVTRGPIPLQSPSTPRPSTSGRLNEQVYIEELTEREREILRYIAQGASNREISETLFITEGTVKNHVSNILTKLGLRDRTQAAIYAREQGLA